MLTLLFSVWGMIMTSTITPFYRLWPCLINQTSMMFLISSTTLLKLKNPWVPNLLSYKLATDWLSTPLIMLSFWLMPVSLMASMSHLKTNATSKTRNFMMTIILILNALMMTFSTTNIMMFFLGFETTLIPTLLLITRWGMQQERMEAGYYFVMYTLISSLPLFMCLLYMFNKKNHSSFTMAKLKEMKQNLTLPMFCLIAFLVKVPMFSLHLWLPKAHVEAPMAGSMMLAAMLLKMGGYGFVRLTTLFWVPFNSFLSSPLIPFCCWGGVLTSMMCLFQTDLKSLMAYSSVSHMSFMMAGVSINTKWAMSGSMIMMVTHGLVSSALFALANMIYERSGTRTITMSRGIKSLFFLLPTLWLMFACANFGLPPLPKAMGELFLFSSMISHNNINMMPILLGTMFTAMFSLTMYKSLNSGKSFNWKSLNKNMKEREYLTIILHLLPLLILITNPKVMTL